MQTFGPQLAAIRRYRRRVGSYGPSTQTSPFVASEYFTCGVREVNMDGSRQEESEAHQSRSCAQIVEGGKLDQCPELVAIHKEAYDGIMHEDRFGGTNGFARQAFDACP